MPETLTFSQQPSKQTFTATQFAQGLPFKMPDVPKILVPSILPPVTPPGDFPDTPQPLPTPSTKPPFSPSF